MFEQYDDLVQAVISDPNTFAIIDIHNYARWEGGIVGQGGSATTEHVRLSGGKGVKGDNDCTDGVTVCHSLVDAGG